MCNIFQWNIYSASMDCKYCGLTAFGLWLTYCLVAVVLEESTERNKEIR